MIVAFTLTFMTALIFGFVVGLCVAKVWKKRDVPTRMDVGITTLEQALRLDQALFECENKSGIGHDHKSSPHVGFWVFVDERSGRVQVSSRHSSRSDIARADGEDAAAAIVELRDRLLAEAAEKTKHLKELRDRLLAEAAEKTKHLKEASK